MFNFHTKKSFHFKIVYISTQPHFKKRHIYRAKVFDNLASSTLYKILICFHFCIVGILKKTYLNIRDPSLLTAQSIYIFLFVVSLIIVLVRIIFDFFGS